MPESFYFINTLILFILFIATDEGHVEITDIQDDITTRRDDIASINSIFI